jgi:hypothetical protein
MRDVDRSSRPVDCVFATQQVEDFTLPALICTEVIVSGMNMLDSTASVGFQ